MKLFLGKKLVNNAISKVLDISSIEDILKIAKNTAALEEAVVELAFNYYKENKQKIDEFLNNISEEDIQKGHDLINKALCYRPEWDSELNITVRFDEEA